jgi:hypothetical protein
MFLFLVICRAASSPLIHWHGYVHDDRVRPQLSRKLDGFLTVNAFAANFPIVTRGEVRTYTLAHHFMKLLARGDSLPAKFGNLSRGPSIYLSAKGPQRPSQKTRRAIPAVVQKQLRHSDARITLGVYGHVIGNQQRDALGTELHEEKRTISSQNTMAASTPLARAGILHSPSCQMTASQ